MGFDEAAAEFAPPPKTFKLLALDIETRPNLAYVWSLWDENIPLERLIESGETFCFAAKWIGERRTHFYSAHRDRAEMVAAAHALLDEADAVMHYNGARFDIPHLNRLIVQAGMTPPSPYQQIDLLRVVKRRFNFPSNKLAYVAPALGLKGKVKHSGFDLWVRCMAGDEKAWRAMERYNRRDVALLEELYGVLRPWIPNHPSLPLYTGQGGCPVCGSDELERKGSSHTRVSVFTRWQCKACGAWSRSTSRDGHVDVSQVG